MFGTYEPPFPQLLKILLQNKQEKLFLFFTFILGGVECVTHKHPGGPVPPLLGIISEQKSQIFADSLKTPPSPPLFYLVKPKKKLRLYPFPTPSPSQSRQKMHSERSFSDDVTPYNNK